MKLNTLIQNIDTVKTLGKTDTEISSIEFDSRNVEKGTLFFALKGVKSDGHDYIKQAIEKGASAVVCEEVTSVAPGNVTIIQVKSSHKALGMAASLLHGNPSFQINVIGITGTNGKTTTVTLLFNLFTKLGYKCGLISTIENRIGEKSYKATHTTPDPIQINLLMAEMARDGCEFCFMEVSSHALHQQRVAGIRFRGAIFSNITHDHLDYHKSFIEYIKVKKSFFDNLDSEAFALINTDDKNGSTMVQNCKAKVYSYSCRSDADFTCKVLENTVDGMLLKFGKNEVWTKFMGLHNAYNLLAVYSSSVLSGASPDEVLVAISSLNSVAGRLEYIRGPRDITAVVDYAHTPDALKNVLKTLKEVGEKRELITVFGCGGDRDKSKRPQMAAISAEFSDRIIVTTDNPRFEEPEKIIEEIKMGFSREDTLKTLFVTDRREAIKVAVTTAAPGSLILIAGKGHETYQEVKGVRDHFDDKEEVNNLFNLM